VKEKKVKDPKEVYTCLKEVLIEILGEKRMQ
jgi:fused signal recognition particle receptor